MQVEEFLAAFMGNLKWVILSVVAVFALLSVALSWGPGDGGVRAKASHILVPTEEEVDKLFTMLSKTEDGSEEQLKLFADLASQHSKCPSGSRSGGSLGVFYRGQMVPEFDRVVFEDAIGKIHKVKTQFGWHLVLTNYRSDADDGTKKEL
jgi:peptidyl-prolyl cis-trans isomerase C